MDTAVVVALIGIIVATLNFVVNPWVQARLERAKENDPGLGWQAAFKALQDQQGKDRARIQALEDENTQLEEKVADLQAQMSDKTTVIVRQERLLRNQGKMIDAFRAYIQSLNLMWAARHEGEALPPPNPDHAYWVHYNPTGEI